MAQKPKPPLLAFATAALILIVVMGVAGFAAGACVAAFHFAANAFG